MRSQHYLEESLVVHVKINLQWLLETIGSPTSAIVINIGDRNENEAAVLGGGGRLGY